MCRMGRRRYTVVVLGCPFREIVVVVVDVFNPADHITVQGALFQYSEAMGSPGLDHATAVGKHLDAFDFEHGAKFGASICTMARDRGSARGHDHSKSGTRFLETTAEHQAVARLEKVEDGGHARERKLTDEDGCVQAFFAFFAFHCIAAGSIGVGESSEN